MTRFTEEALRAFLDNQGGISRWVWGLGGILLLAFSAKASNGNQKKNTG